jgi:hypothetical protein
MKLKYSLLIATLTLAAISAQAAEIKLSTLPIVITAPGTYVLTASPAFYSNPYLAAISINITVRGAVVLDLGGYTVSGNAGCTGVTIQRGQSRPNLSSITVRNGTITGFTYGVVAGVNSSSYSSNIHIDGLTLNNLQFDQVNSSTISNCTFVGNSSYGIQDLLTQGGNVYTNNSFSVSQTQLQVTSADPLLLEHGSFAAPTN